ncbi:hypothetical protein WJX74_007691 [Apatococcus lobatus]|uniref:Uncharacterized protein n=1 Tax=Apatococcus lobatus TaxID=904363 RepID=A0AAW1QKY3_9CHLO
MHFGQSDEQLKKLLQTKTRLLDQAETSLFKAQKELSALKEAKGVADKDLKQLISARLADHKSSEAEIQEAQRWRQRAEHAEHERSKLEAQLSAARSQGKLNMDRLQTDLQDLRFSNKENQGANAARNSMEAQLREAQRRMAQAQHEHARQVMQLQHSLKHEADSSSQLEAQAAQLHEAIGAKKAAQHAADSFSQQLKKLQQESDQQQQITRQAELTAYNTQTDLQHSQAACSKLEASKRALQASLDQSGQQLKETRAKMQSQQRLLQEVANEHDNAQASIKKLEVAVLTAQHDQAVTNAATLRLDENSSASQASLKAQHSKLQVQHESAMTELEIVQTRLVHAAQRCSDLQQAIDAKQNNLSVTSTALAEKEGEATVLTAAIDTLEAEVQRQRQMQTEQAQRFASAGARLAELESDLQSMQKAMDAESHDHASVAERQQEAMLKLQAELKMCQEAYASLKAAHSVAEERLTGVRSELAEKAALLDQAGVDVEELQLANTELRRELESSLGARDALDVALTAIKQRMDIASLLKHEDQSPIGYIPAYDDWSSRTSNLASDRACNQEDKEIANAS